MKHTFSFIWTLSLMLLLLSATFGFAQEAEEGERRRPLREVEWRGFGAGIVLGEPTGLTAKVWMGEHSALDAAVAWSFIGDGSLYVHGGYLFHFAGPVGIEEGELLPYAGAGAKVVFADDPEVAIRVPLGVGYFFEEVPVEVFLELAPGLQLYPETSVDVTGGIGARYYFRPRS